MQGRQLIELLINYNVFKLLFSIEWRKIASPGRIFKIAPRVFLPKKGRLPASQWLVSILTVFLYDTVVLKVVSLSGIEMESTSVDTLLKANEQLQQQLNQERELREQAEDDRLKIKVSHIWEMHDVNIQCTLR